MNWRDVGFANRTLNSVCMIQKSPSEDFGKALRSLRGSQHLSLAELATRAHLSPTYLSLIERDQRPPPPKETVGRLLDALHVSSEEAHMLLRKAELARGVPELELGLPEDVQELLRLIRASGKQLPSTFVRGLQAKIREVI